MKKKTYSPEFKREAVRLLMTEDKPVTELARELGVKRSLLYAWRDQQRQSDAELEAGQARKSSSKELERLKSENKELKEELEILKKAAAYFARELK